MKLNVENNSTECKIAWLGGLFLKTVFVLVAHLFMGEQHSAIQCVLVFRGGRQDPYFT